MIFLQNYRGPALKEICTSTDGYIAEALAKRGYNLILIARHVGALQEAKDKLEAKYGIHAELLVHDLRREIFAGNCRLVFQS